MDAGVEICLASHREKCEELAEHLAQRNDDKGFELLDSVLDAEFVLLRVLNDAWRRVKGKENVAAA